MSTMRLDLSLCGMWYCEALVLLVGVYYVEFLHYHGRTVICTMYAAACSISVVVYSALLVCYVLVGKKLSVVLSWGGSSLFSRLGGVFVGAGWLNYFYGFWSFSRASKILLGAMIELSFNKIFNALLKPQKP